MNVTHEKQADWGSLRQGLGSGADLYLPDRWQYHRYVTPENLHYQNIEPQAIVFCASTDDVAHTMRWRARQKEEGVDVKVVPRAGGHNYAGFSTTNGLLVHLGGMKQIIQESLGSRHRDRDPGRLVQVAAGITLQDMTAFGRQTGLYVPGGRCPTVGLAGLTLGGGIGLNDRKWGLTCDHLVETEIVCANGEVLLASEDEHPDLFWACRGGAGNNFGINTRFVYEAQSVEGLEAAYFRFVVDQDKDWQPALQAVQEAILADNQKPSQNLECRVGLQYSGGRCALEVLGQYVYDANPDPRSIEREVNSALRGLTKLQADVQVIRYSLDFWDAQDLLHDPEGPSYRYSKCLLLFEDFLADGTADDIKERLSSAIPVEHRNDDSCNLYVTLFATGGQVKRGPQPIRSGEYSGTAYPQSHRDATYIVDVGATWTRRTLGGTIKSLKDSVEALYRDLVEQVSTEYAYVNFPDPRLVDWEKGYYGENYEKLCEVKEKYDRRRVFDYEQGIGHQPDTVPVEPSSL